MKYFSSNFKIISIWPNDVSIVEIIISPKKFYVNGIITKIQSFKQWQTKCCRSSPSLIFAHCDTQCRHIVQDLLQGIMLHGIWQKILHTSFLSCLRCIMLGHLMTAMRMQYSKYVTQMKRRQDSLYWRTKFITPRQDDTEGCASNKPCPPSQSREEDRRRRDCCQHQHNLHENTSKL